MASSNVTGAFGVETRALGFGWAGSAWVGFGLAGMACVLTGAESAFGVGWVGLPKTNTKTN